MTYSSIVDYHNCIQMIQGEKSSLEMGIISYPHMKVEAQKKFRKSMESLAVSHLDKSDEAPANTEELYHSIMGQLSGR